MKYFLTTLFMALLFSILGHAEGPQFREPDFDFPVKVETEARALLAQAQKQPAPQAGRTRLRALVELFAAQSVIDSDSAFTQPATVASLLTAPNNTPADRAMLLTLQAHLYWQILQSNYWKYSRVDAPLTPLPADVSEWSADQFKSEIARLLSEALAIPQTATSPLADYSASVEVDTFALTYLPTVRDFILYQGTQQDSDPMKYIDLGLADAPKGSGSYFYWSVAKLQQDYSDRSQRMLQLYADNANVEAARYVLEQLASSCPRSVEVSDLTKQVIAYLKTSLQQFPQWYGNANLEYSLNDLTSPVVEITGPSLVAPGVEFKADISCSFTDSLTLYLFYRENDKYLNLQKLVKQFKPEVTRTLSAQGDNKFSVAFTTTRQGTYWLVGCVKDAQGTPTYTFYSFESAGFVPLAFSGRNKSCILTLDYVDGKPVSGVRVSRASNSYADRNKKPQLIGTTPASGMLSVASVDKPAYLKFEYKGYSTDFNRNINLYNFSGSSDEQRQQRMIVLTDRSLYHPGDSLEWAVVLGEKNKETHILANQEITVKLMNANYQAVDTARVRTDNFGRANGVFIIPTGQLTGDYTVIATCGSRANAQNSVMVSDFRAPEFYVDVTSVQRDVPAPGAVRIEGKARTFSGMPVAGADVAVTLSGSALWWRISPQQEIGTYNARTDAQGAFTIDFGADNFADKRDGDAPLTNFAADITVTAPDASTASTVTRFTVGKPYSLSVDLPESHDTSTPLQLTFRAQDANGTSAPIAVRWALVPVTDGGATAQPAAQGNAVCDTPASLSLGELAAGQYRLTLTPADSTLANTFTTGSVLTLYNVQRNLVPDIPDQPVFIPVDNITLDASGKAIVQIGVTEPTVIYTVLDDNGDFKSVESHTLTPGFTGIPVSFSADTDGDPLMGMKIANVKNGQTSVQQVTFVRAAKPEPKLVVQSFRDKLTPGTTETWTIRLLDSDGTPMPSVPAIATMYNRALEDLYSSNWRSAFGFSSPRFQVNYSTVWTYSQYMQLYPTVDRDDRNQIQWPYWRYINQLQSRAVMMRGYAVAKGMAANLVVEDAAVDDLSAPMLEEAAAASADTAPEEEISSEPAEEYRAAEVLQAFWMPSLVADAEGNINIVFTVPNANATWTFRSLAWTPEARTAALALEALANKPVMVQPNMPRFLRQGDSAIAFATVYNNSGADATVATSVEIFNPATGAVLATSEFSDSITAGGSGLVQIGLPGLTDANAVGYRVRSRLGSFSDGEQGLIPILPSSATVIESTEFYLNPTDTKPFTLTVPAAKDATLTLQYCQNPVWTIVRAMRGIGSADGFTSTSLVGKLFSALAARSIIAGNPAISAAIAEWTSNPTSHALESMLSRNDDLKQLMLDQTPWVQTAADQSARMAALANVLASGKTEAAISEYVDKIVKLQTANGGIRWSAWTSEPSEWSTRTVLTTLGIARSLGIIPAKDSKLAELTQSAWAYVCGQVAKRKEPDTDFDLAYIAAMLPELKTDAATAKIIGRTVDAIRTGWKGASVLSKARDILILKANGLQSEAEPVFESIRQFAVERPGMGMCFPNISDIRSYATIIQAYKAMGASATEINALRQWVIVQAQASDDIFAYNPDYLIAAVMLSGTDWTAVPVAQNVTVNGHSLEISNIENATGYFAQTLKPTAQPVTITVTPNGVTPSYGSVISIANRPMASIQARPGRDVSIEKRVLVQQNGQWVETNSFTAGQRLRVQLIIKAKRALDYVTIDDERPAAFEPVDQLPGYIYDGSLACYRENLDASTRLFINHMPAGTYHLSYEMTANVAGSFISGIATLQSQYAPELTAHSAASTITVK